MTSRAGALNPETVSALDDSLRQRYSDRFKRLGSGPKSLGWDTREHQFARFEAAAECLNTRDRSVLDIGCGLADFYQYLSATPETKPAHYTGFDINDDFITHCRDHLPQCEFEQRNVLTAPVTDRRWDVVTAFGVLNLRLKDIDNREFARAMMETAFSMCDDAAAVDMLTTIRDDAYPEEDFVYYYDPSEMLRVALEITPHVLLRHDRSSIPQREMLIVMKRHP